MVSVERAKPLELATSPIRESARFLSARQKRKRVHDMKLNELRDNAGARKSQDARRTRHRFGQGQDRRPWPEGPEEPRRRLDRRLRRRPDAAPHAVAEARLQQHLRQGLCRGEPGRDPEAGRCRQARGQGATIDHAALKAAGVARGGKDGVRLLAKGEFSAKLNFTVAGASKGAIEAVEKAGGKVEVIEVVAAADKAASQEGRRAVRARKADKEAKQAAAKAKTRDAVRLAAGDKPEHGVTI